MDSLFPYLSAAELDPQFETLKEQAAAAEAWETPHWAARAILDKEILTQRVVDPCCGMGVLTEAARRAGYQVFASDLYTWGYPGADETGCDFLTHAVRLDGATVLMNPPFSLATKFVDQAFRLGARKIVCFQRQAWRESDDRKAWWDNAPPARVWVCGSRAIPYLITIPPEDRKAMNGMQTAHAWYVWETGHKGAEIGGAIYKEGYV